MVWTKEQVDEIAEELMATDIAYDLAKIQDYDEDKCALRGESGTTLEATLRCTSCS